MKRFISIGLGIAMCAAALAQSSFTIRRPADGSTVREVVKIRIPKSSIGPGNYVGILVNGKLLEAVSPTAEQLDGKDFVYSLDTKGRQIADGPLKLEAVLYGIFGAEGGGETHAIVNRSSVRVRLDNRTSLKAPAGGYHLRYKFNPGTNNVYKLEYKQSISVMSEAQAKLGGRPPELPQNSFTARYMYAVDNAYPMPGGRKDGLVRMQLLPVKGKDYAILPLAGDPEAKKRYQEQFTTVYYRVSDTGREVFGRSPAYFGVEGTEGPAPKILIYGVFPLPLLPTRGVSQGDSWASGFVTSSPLTNDLAEIYSKEKLSEISPARGTIEAIEYERGMKCVRIRNTIATSQALSNDVQSESEEVYWFSIDRGIIVKLERTYTTTVRVKSEGGGSAGSGGGSRGSANGGGAPSGGKRGGRGAPADAGFTSPGTLFQEGDEAAARGGGSGPGRGPGRGGMGSGAGGNRSGGGTRIMKSRVKFILTLE
ncbi:MAG: hypothetical protein JNM04_07095 [Chthonomonas sp.]|nr:hypothetical protein [Chthonomonas sp.]